MSDALNEAISRRGVRASECVRLPVYTLDVDAEVFEDLRAAKKEAARVRWERFKHKGGRG